MAKFFLTKKAVEDISKIWEYTYDQWSELQAEKYYRMLLDTCQDLADNNISGKPYPEISAGILGFKAGRHKIFFRGTKKGSGIEIARILHERMDLKNKM